MERLWILRTVILVLVLSPVSSIAQQLPSMATVHFVVMDGFGRDLGDAKVDSFKENSGAGKDFAKLFRNNLAKDIPYGVYEIRAYKTGYFTGQAMVQVFQPDVWVVVGLRAGEELPKFPAPRMQLTGTVKNSDPGEEPVYLRLMAVYSDFMVDAKVTISGQSGTFTFAGIIPDGKYILITNGATRILDVRQLKLDFPAKEPIVVDLKPIDNQENRR
jgi:hypothetical protein